MVVMYIESFSVPYVASLKTNSFLTIKLAFTRGKEDKKIRKILQFK